MAACPNCGHCPACGRSDSQPRRLRPVVPMVPRRWYGPRPALHVAPRWYQQNVGIAPRTYC